MSETPIPPDTTQETVPGGIPLLDQIAPDAPDEGGNEVVIITGCSGAGRTGAARALEDLDWYVVDNLPPAMLPALVGMMSPDGGGVHRLAVVVDVRSREFFADFARALEQLKELGVA